MFKGGFVFFSILVVQNQASPDSGPGQRIDSLRFKGLSFSLYWWYLVSCGVVP